MSLAISVVGIALAAAVSATLLQKNSPGFALLVSLAASLLLMTKVGLAAQRVLTGVMQLAQKTDTGAYGCLLRCTGIVLLTDHASTLCEEAGAVSVAWCTVLAGRVLALAAVWPLLEEVGLRIGSMMR